MMLLRVNAFLKISLNAMALLAPDSTLIAPVARPIIHNARNAPVFVKPAMKPKMCALLAGVLISLPIGSSMSFMRHVLRNVDWGRGSIAQQILALSAIQLAFYAQVMELTSASSVIRPLKANSFTF